MRKFSYKAAFETTRAFLCAALYRLGVGSASIVLLSSISQSAYARLVTFEELAVPPGQVVWVTESGGLKFSMDPFPGAPYVNAIGVIDATSLFGKYDLAESLPNGAVFSPRIQYLITTVSGDEFDLTSLYIGSTHGTSFLFEGLQNGNVVYSASIVESQRLTPEFVQFNWSNLDAFRVSARYLNGYAVMDNIVYTAPIPEPGTYAMLLAGLGLLGFAARRRKLKLAA